MVLLRMRRCGPERPGLPVASGPHGCVRSLAWPCPEPKKLKGELAMIYEPAASNLSS